MNKYFVSFVAKKDKSTKDIFGRCTLHYENKIMDEFALNDLEDAVAKLGYKSVSIIFWRKYES